MYIVIELQTANGQTANIVTAYQTKREAEAKYHAVLSAASMSTVPIHACTILNEFGSAIRYESYTHDAETEGGETT